MQKLALYWWPWITLVLGLAVVVCAYVDAAITGVWFDDHGLPDDINAVPQVILGALGFVLVVGGGVCGVIARGSRAKRANLGAETRSTL